ncbi:hypothetical protein [Rhizobium sp. Root482]|uniref:hypothetical protein n=1 Tax=Rhizobium sp. Root482 TaxID=1736543 RepID=UPI000A8069ED|nr:hypothetical protein [Rhizobium sp. Root482]
MRSFTLPHPTKAMVAACLAILSALVILSASSFAEARDRGEGHFKRRGHDRPHHQRQEAISGINADRHHRHRDRDVWLSGRNAERHFDRRDDRYSDRRHFDRDRRPDSRIVIREYRDRSGRRDDESNFPSQSRGGTYFGGLSAWTDPGNGIYFSSERGGYGYGTYDGETVYPPSRPKIIHVNPRTASRACSYEAGVCVIRR